jgi:TetR/AcrR family transcriptional regulator
MSTKTRDPEATRAAILDAAERVFLDHGFSAAPMSRIADQAGVSKGLLHHHFESKQGLWHEVKLRRFKEYSEKQMQMIEESEPEADLLKRSMEEYFRFLQRNPEMVRMLAWVFLERDQDECTDLDEELTRAGVERIREGQEQGELRADLNPGFILFTFIGMCQHWFQDKAHLLENMGLSANSAAVDEAYLEDMTKIFFEGVLPR